MPKRDAARTSYTVMIVVLLIVAIVFSVISIMVALSLTNFNFAAASPQTSAGPMAGSVNLVIEGDSNADIVQPGISPGGAPQ